MQNIRRTKSSQTPNDHKIVQFDLEAPTSFWYFEAVFDRHDTESSALTASGALFHSEIARNQKHLCAFSECTRASCN